MRPLITITLHIKKMAVHLNVASRACLQASICDKLGVRERLSISIRQVSVHLWDPSGSDKIVIEILTP